jgi:DNA primase
MSLSPQFLDELRSRTLMSALVGKSLKITKAGREFKGCCPFHNEKTPSFYVNDEKGFYHCFGCSAHGDAIRWMTDQRGLGFMDAVKELADAAGMEVPAADPRAAEKAERANSLYDVMTAAADWFVEQLGGIEGAGARAYLEKRGLKPAIIKAFGLGFAPDTRGKLKTALAHFGEEKLIESGLLIKVEEKDSYDRFRGRLMIPIRDPRGRVIAFGGRIIGAGEPKYLNSPDTPLFDKGRTLYNLDAAGPESRKTGRVIVVEGYMDVIALAQAGMRDAVAPLGTALTEHQLERLWHYTNVPLLCFDGDSAGQKAAIRAGNRALPNLKPGYSLDFVTLPVGEDPADFVERGAGAALEKLFSSTRKGLAQTLWEYEVISEPTNTPEARAGLKERLISLSATIQNKLVSDEYRSTLQSLWWETFGWGRKTISDVRASMFSYREEPNKQLRGAFLKAVLYGFMRYPAVLRGELEALASLAIDDPHLDSWRNVLFEAAVQRPDLDEDMIDTILAQSDVSPIEARDLRRDLAFTFYFKNHEDGAQHLREVVATLNAEQMIEIELARASERFKAATEDGHWAEQQRLFSAREALMKRLRELVDNDELEMTG